MTDKKDKPDYRDSVFLPKTDFPMRAGLAKKEPEILARWNEINLYEQLRKKGESAKEKFILHDGPPYANGNIHMGHAVNKVLKDVIVKSHTMLGKDAPYVPGWDCHGLPIEWKIEEKYRKEGKDKDDVDILEFRKECREFAAEWINIQSDQFQRLGITGDWKTPYKTMTNRAEGLIAREIHKFAKQGGGLYKGLRPVMWSVVEKTALAEAEVEYQEHKSVTIWVKFPVVHTEIAGHEQLLTGEKFGENEKPASVVIWTTTPWTIPSNRAVAFGKNIEYGVYVVKTIQEGSIAQIGEKLVIAKKLSEEVRVSAKIDSWEEDVHTLRAEHLEGMICKHPLAEEDNYYSAFDVPLIQGEFVTDDAGTGFVHIAPGHGEDDFNLVRAHNSLADTEWTNVQGMEEPKIKRIEVTDNVTDDGKFRPHVALFAGEEIYTQEGKLGGGNFSVLRELKEADKLLAKGSLKHEYPHSWRSKAPLIFRTTPQWFIAMDGEGEIRNQALEQIKLTNWHPAKGEARINAMIANRPDWCISRQRAWGVPIALFLHKDTGEMLRDDAVFDRIGDIFEEEGADAWWSRDPQDFLGNEYKAEDYTQVFDIVDVWFESGSTHAFVVGDTQTWPCFEGVDQIDLYLEGSDQHRGWFHSSLLQGTGTRGRAPYKNVLTHGFVLDEKGYKMSKSLGNVVDPLKMMDTYGADIIRLWVMLSDYNEDIRIGRDTLKNTSDLYRRLRNTLRFLLGALDGYTTEESVPLDQDLPELEQYMLHLLAETDEFVREAIENYEFGKIAKHLHDFCNQELSAFYFDIRKDCLYCDAPDDMKRRACRTVLAEIFNHLTVWLAPILSFTAEEAWQHRPEGVFEDTESIHLRDFPEVPSSWKNEELDQKWEEIVKTRKDVLAAIEPMRTSKELGSSLEAMAEIHTESETVQNMTDEMADICITSAVKISPGARSVIIAKAPGEKCERCWKVLPEVSEATGHLCSRCESVVKQTKSRAA